ncbi:uncharacterized protein LOC103473251 isoform X2 [Poecilia reticulata]|uniref:uncharacterized protein LOC103473251 isoform X2 n=1 Tax=Poecilia reticulata TaxID=8081 RepID=UPI0004A2513E|nr:PREDICTED: uncharacterized protein LOC103473251 isoform X2 [Poecilia reticulata]
MDPHRIVWAVMVGLLGATRLSSGANCTCPKIPPKNFTVQKDGCFKVTYRYECIPGYTRKPGTSNLIRCQEKNGVSQWAESKFECITDPNYRPPPTTTRVPSGPSSTLQSVRTSTSEPSASPNMKQSPLGPSSTLQSVRTSTSEPSASTNTERSALGGEGTAVCISLVGLILLLAVGGVIFLYRQRKNSIPPRDPEELEVMKC